MNQEKLRQRRTLVEGKVIIGIDPAKKKHQAALVDESGIQLGSSFSFPVSHEGFEMILWSTTRRRREEHS